MHLITFHSLTQAQTARRRLESEQLPAELRKTPRALAARGCGYALSVPDPEAERAVSVLREGKLTYSQLFRPSGDGKKWEALL